MRLCLLPQRGATEPTSRLRPCTPTLTARALEVRVDGRPLGHSDKGSWAIARGPGKAARLSGIRPNAAVQSLKICRHARHVAHSDWSRHHPGCRREHSIARLRQYPVLPGGGPAHPCCDARCRHLDQPHDAQRWSRGFLRSQARALQALCKHPGKRHARRLEGGPRPRSGETSPAPTPCGARP